MLVAIPCAYRFHNFSDPVADAGDGVDVAFDFHSDTRQALHELVDLFPRIARKLLHALHKTCHLVQRKAQKRGKP